MISGQSANYIEAALQTYKKGDRKHPTMRSISDQNMADLVFYYCKHGLVEGQMASKKAVKGPSVEVAALSGKANCASCHGADFSSPIDPSYPKIGGQHADYLYVALKAYKINNNAKVGSNNAIMASMAKQYSKAELKLIANYLASVPGDVKVIPQSRFIWP
jgi:cytochrome c553